MRTKRVLAPVVDDGRRKFGTVRDAIVQVLQEAGSELRVRDIHARVEGVLGEEVSASSVKDYLLRTDGDKCRSSSTAVEMGIAWLGNSVSKRDIWNNTSLRFHP